MARKQRIQKLPAPTSAPRVESGAVQFGDDWPGLFLRGDDCIALAADIRRLCQELGPDRLMALPMGMLNKLAEAQKLIERDVIAPPAKRKRYEFAKDKVTQEK